MAAGFGVGGGDGGGGERGLQCSAARRWVREFRCEVRWRRRMGRELEGGYFFGGFMMSSILEVTLRELGSCV